MKSISDRRLRILFRVLVALIMIGAGFLIARALTRYGLAEIASAWREIGISHFAGAAALAVASYLLLTGFDYFGLHYAGRPLAYRRAAITSFVALSIGHNIGVAVFSSGAVRYRFYTHWGLSAEQVAKVIAFSGATVALGLATLGGLAMLAVPGDAAYFLGLGRGSITLVAFGSLALPAAYCAAAVFLRREVRIWSWRFALPSPRLAVAQVVVGTLNFACVAGCLHQLMLGLENFAYARVAAVYVIANVSGLVSHVPGGLGVLEATANYLFQSAAALPALVAFRLVYFLGPLVVGVASFATIEFSWRRNGATPAEASQQPAERPERA